MRKPLLLIEQDRKTLGGLWRIVERQTTWEGLGHTYCIKVPERFVSPSLARPQFNILKALVINNNI